MQHGCNHRARPSTLLFTELGCHASCLSCEAIGPERPNSEEARRALLALAKNEDSRYT